MRFCGWMAGEVCEFGEAAEKPRFWWEIRFGTSLATQGCDKEAA